LDQLLETNPTALKIMAIDNEGFHKTERTITPENIILLFIPPY
jgi:hypothetical protein